MFSSRGKLEIKSDDIRVTLAGAGRLCVTDRRSRHHWKSSGALFRMAFYDIASDRVQRVDLQDAELIAANGTSGRLKLWLTHKNSGISLHVYLQIERDTLVFGVPAEGIIEAKKAQFVLLSLEFNPCGFFAETGDAGYLLLPNYGGMTCSFNHTQPVQYRSLIYLEQRRWEDIPLLPVFGMVCRNSAFLSIVESGEFDTEVITSLCWGENKTNSVHALFHYRYSKNDQVDPVERRIRFHFLSGRQAGYVGMAKRYRDYLVDAKGLVPLKEKIKVSPEAAYVYNAYGFVKIFCAEKGKASDQGASSRFTTDGSSEYRIYTTFKEAGQIMERFKKEGIGKARFILVGWNWDGHDGRYPTRFPVDHRLGGEAGLRELIQTARGLDYQITFHDNYSDAYRASPDWNEEIMLKDREGRLVAGGVWAGGQSFFPCPHEASKLFLHRDLPRIKELGLYGWYYLDATPRVLRGCYDAGHGHLLTRRAEAEGIMEQFRAVRAYFGGCSVEMPTAFVLPDVDEVAHIPCPNVWNLSQELKGLSGEVVPFFHIAVHGLIIYHLHSWINFRRLFGSTVNGILKEAEWGAMPRTEVTFRPSEFQEYHKHIRWVKKEYGMICRDLGHLQMEFMEDHKKVAPGVFETTYSDGTKVVINYRDKSYKLDEGKVIKRKSYMQCKTDL